MAILSRADARKLAGQQRGLSILELLIALFLGSVIIAGATKIFLSNTQSLRLQESVSAAQENGRLAMEIMLADLRRAGVGDPIASAATAQVEVTGTNGATTTSAGTGLLTASDNVQIAYVATEVSTDCEGHAAAEGDTIINRYSVRNDAGLAALVCAGVVINGVSGASNPTAGMGTGLALVRGVESFQVLYGVGAAANPGNGYAPPVRYVTGITSAGAVVPVVSSIRVALLVRSETGIDGLPAPSNNLAVLDTSITSTALAAARDATGRYFVHRFFTGTAALRNSAGGSL